MYKILLSSILLFISGLSFASEFIPTGLSNPTQELINENTLDKKKEESEDEQVHGLVITSVQGTQFSITTSEFLALVQLIPEEVLDGFNLRLSNLAIIFFSIK